MPLSLFHINSEIASKIEKLAGKKFGGLLASMGEDAMLVVLTGKDRRMINRWYNHALRGSDVSTSPAEQELAGKLFKDL